MAQGTATISPDVFSKMQTGVPVSSYKKTILAKVQIDVINPWSGQREYVIMYGDPKKNEEGTIYDVWSEQEDTYFRRANKRHFETGTLAKYTRKSSVVEKNPNEITDEEIEKILKSPYFSMTSKLAEFTAVAPVYRFLEMAKELEKSEKFIKAIEARISELEV